MKALLKSIYNIIILKCVQLFLSEVLDISTVDIGSTYSRVDYPAKTVPTDWSDHIDKTCPAKTQMSNIWQTSEIFSCIQRATSKLPETIYESSQFIYLCPLPGTGRSLKVNLLYKTV